MTWRISITRSQISLWLFAMFFCFLFVFQYTRVSYIDEAIIIIFLPLLSFSQKQRFSLHKYMAPIMMMCVFIVAWSTESHKSFIYYFIMLEAVFFLRPKIDDLHVITDTIKITAIVNAFFVLFERIAPDIMTAYANLMFTDSAALGYSAALRKGYYSGLNNQVAFTSAYLSLGIMIVTYDKRTPRDRRIIQLIFLWLALLATNKRGHLIYLIVAMLIVYYTSSVKSKKMDRALKIIFIALVVVVLLYFVASLFPSIPLFARLMSFTSIFDGTGDFNSVSSGRIAIYDQVIELFKSNQIWGIGWENYGDYSKAISLNGGVNQGHNVFLQLLCETGIVGFTLIFLINLYYFISAFRLNTALVKMKNIGNQSICDLDLYRKCCIGFMVFYYLFWFSGNAIYDFTFVYTWICSILLCNSLKWEIYSRRLITQNHYLSFKR